VGSSDTYVRQAATLLIAAENAPLSKIQSLFDRKTPKHALAGILAAGFRLTITRPQVPPPRPYA